MADSLAWLAGVSVSLLIIFACSWIIFRIFRGIMIDVGIIKQKKPIVWRNIYDEDE